MKSLVLLPSYNSGSRLAQTLRQAQAEWPDVWTVIDGSTDGSPEEAARVPGIRLLRLEKNAGKGAAVLHGFAAAQASGFTHALVMDADGQHPPEMVRPFMAAAEKSPHALICGIPTFGPDAPRSRVLGRRAGNFFAHLETLGRGPRDSLCGFRLYPIAPTLAAFEKTRTGRAFDFETVAGVRLAWSGTPCIDIPIPVRYPKRSEGGVTHFRYLRDNLLLTRIHTSLLLQAPLHFPKVAPKSPFGTGLGH